MNVLFAPDYREGDPYQSNLAGALAGEGVAVDFLRHNRRVLPLARSLRHRPFDLLHLHWHEPYIQRGGTWRDVPCRLRWPLDLSLALHGRPLVYTAHNLMPHDQRSGAFLRQVFRYTISRADAVITHSPGARDRLLETFPVEPEDKVHVIPLGDSTRQLPPPVPRAEARARLGLDADRPICLMPGTVRPYKGIGEIIRAWGDNWPADLHVVGHGLFETYTRELTELAAGRGCVHLHLQRQSDEQLRDWLCAADCGLVNYATIFSSGIAPLLRSWGLPLLVPQRCTSLELHEPSPRVLRFASPVDDLLGRVADALKAPQDEADLTAWRASVAWEPIAARTAALYRSLTAR